MFMKCYYWKDKVNILLLIKLPLGEYSTLCAAPVQRFSNQPTFGNVKIME